MAPVCRHRSSGIRSVLTLSDLGSEPTDMSDAKPAKNDTMTAKTLLKGLGVLEAFDHQHRELSTAEIIKITGLEASAARRFVSTLLQAGYLVRCSSPRRYRLSPKVLGFTTAYLGSDPLIICAQPVLQQLAERTGLLVEMKTPYRNNLVTLLKFSDKDNQISQFRGSSVGNVEPIHCLAAGLVSLSRMDLAQALEILTSAPLKKYTDKTITDVEELIGRVLQARKENHAICSGEYLPGIIGVSSAVLDFSGQLAAAVAVAAPNSEYSIERVRAELAPLVIKTANNISMAYQRET